MIFWYFSISALSYHFQVSFKFKEILYVAKIIRNADPAPFEVIKYKSSNVQRIKLQK